MRTPRLRPRPAPARHECRPAEIYLWEQLQEARAGADVASLVRGVLVNYTEGHGKEGAQEKARDLLAWCLHDRIEPPPDALRLAGIALPEDAPPDGSAEMGFTPRHARRFTGRLSELALDGLAGDIVRALRPHTEACDAAVLVHLLTAFAVCAGPNALLHIGTETHPARLFSVLVGPTGRGRKGTAWGAASFFLHRAYPALQVLTRSTIQSGEALVEAVRDGTGDEDPGVTDKRLHWLETEFHNVLSVKRRQASILTGMIRDAWDYGDLHNGTKKPAHATKPHVGIAAHITAEELLASVSSTDGYSGLLNRFLFIYSEAARRLPMPEPVPDGIATPLVMRLRRAIDAAQTPGPVAIAPDVTALWSAALYGRLIADEGGLMEALQVRAHPYVWRLATTYALLDCRREIQMRDVAAAVALWHYHVESIRHIFGSRTGSTVADRIGEELRARSEMTRADISELLGRHKSVGEINDALSLLYNDGAALFEKRETGGRPVEVWRWNGGERSEEREASGLLSLFSRPVSNAAPADGPPVSMGDGTADVPPADPAPRLLNVNERVNRYLSEGNHEGFSA